MSKKTEVELGGFVGEHPTTAVAELLSVLNDPGALNGEVDKDVISAYLLRVADAEGVPESIRSIARQLYREWDYDTVSASASAFLSLGGMLH